MLQSMGSQGVGHDLATEQQVYIFLSFITKRKERLPTPVFWPGEFHALYIVHELAKSRTQLSDFHFHLFIDIPGSCQGCSDGLVKCSVKL